MQQYKFLELLITKNKSQSWFLLDQKQVLLLIFIINFCQLLPLNIMIKLIINRTY